jgi:hypothetical protein
MSRFRNAFGFVLMIGSLFGFAGCALESPAMIDPGETAGLRAAAAEKEVASADEYLAFDKLAAASSPPAQLVELPSADPATAPASARQVIYSAAYRIVVADIAGSLTSIRKNAEQLGGYLQEVSGNAITVRVPASKFNDAIAFVERVGEVVDRQLKAQDITEEMHDLQTRIDNQERLRQRFQALLAKAEKVEDALKIEQELARVTEELDKAKGKLRYLQAQVAMSSIRVELNSPMPQTHGTPGTNLPFDWVNQLGDGIVEGQVQQTVRKAGIFGRGPRFKPPADFVRYYEANNVVEAMNADGLRLRVIRRENVDKAGIDFWSTLVRKSLVENRALSVVNEERGDFYILQGTRDVGGKQLGYVLGLKRSNGHVVAFEAWGAKESIDRAFDALRRSSLSVDAG